MSDRHNSKSFFFFSAQEVSKLTYLHKAQHRIFCIYIIKFHCTTKIWEKLKKLKITKKIHFLSCQALLIIYNNKPFSRGLDMDYLQPISLIEYCIITSLLNAAHNGRIIDFKLNIVNICSMQIFCLFITLKM